MPTTTRVLIAEDHALVRAGIVALLKSLPGIEVVAEATNGREAVELARALTPDVVLMDIAMAERNGIEATVQVLNTSPRTRVVILSMHVAALVRLAVRTRLLDPGA